MTRSPEGKVNDKVRAFAHGFAKDMRLKGFCLDFSYRSLEHEIDKILTSKHIILGDWAAGWKNEALLGAYVGETLASLLGGVWKGKFNNENPGPNFYLSYVEFGEFRYYPSHFLQRRIADGPKVGTFRQHLQRVLLRIREGKSPHDQWGSSISLVLYLVIFHKDPREHIDRIADLFIEQRNPDELSTIVHEIDRELKEPTQRVSEILDFVHSPSEEIVREFLHGVSLRLKEHLRKPQEKEHLTEPQEFDGPCSVCGKPGHVQNLPGVPASDCFCEDHTPDFTLQPIHIFIALGLLLGLGWLMYRFFFR